MDVQRTSHSLPYRRRLELEGYLVCSGSREGRTHSGIHKYIANSVASFPGMSEHLGTRLTTLDYCQERWV